MPEGSRPNVQKIKAFHLPWWKWGGKQSEEKQEIREGKLKSEDRKDETPL